MKEKRGADRTLLVIAKAPIPGRVKTRLHPPCTLGEAAGIAAGALADTLRAVAGAPARRRVLILEGPPGPWVPPGFDVIPQRGLGLDERLAAAFEDAGAPALLVGMDTPQVSPRLLADGLEALLDGPDEAVLGLADDGGWWAIGLRCPDPRVFMGIPMSRPYTGRAQIQRLEGLGYRWTPLETLRDVDDFDDALAVAAQVPGSAFAKAVGDVESRLARSRATPILASAGPW